MEAPAANHLRDPHERESTAWNTSESERALKAQALSEFVERSRNTAPAHPHLTSPTGANAHAIIDGAPRLKGEASSYRDGSVKQLQPAMEVAQVILYGAEWFVGTIVWGGTADRLDNAAGCYFGKQSSCTFIILAGVCAWLLLNLLIGARILAKFSPKFEFLTGFEAHATTLMGFTWTLVALVASVAAPSRGQKSTGNAVIVFAWADAALTFVSAALAINFRRQEDDFSIA